MATRTQPPYDLIFTFPDSAARTNIRGGDRYSSDHGVIAPSGWSFDYADVEAFDALFTQRGVE